MSSSMRLRTAVTLAKTSGRLARASGRGGTSLPGKVLTRLQPNAISEIASQLPAGCAVLSATNGKTTTAALVAAIFEQQGTSLVHNRQGANMAGGIASTLLESFKSGAPDGEFGLFEVDEFWLNQLVPQLQPRALLLSNLFRDQLDRYGELETIVERWCELADSMPELPLVLGADDPAIADIGSERATVIYFGIEDPSVALDGLEHASDAINCRRCGSPLIYTATFVGHLGHYRCSSCDNSRPKPSVVASQIKLDALRGSTFTLELDGESYTVTLRLPGLYNVYNALSAAALCLSLGVSGDDIAAGLQTTSAAFGRAETVSIDGQQLQLLLIKNPAGANEVIRTLALADDELWLLSILNDRIADGRDVSWIWDANFELLAEKVAGVVCTGIRAEEMALRWKYAGVPADRITVVNESLSNALDATLNLSTSEEIYAIPTYTAMLELREELVNRGAAEGSFV